MRVHWKLANRKRVRLLAALFSKRVTLADVNWGLSLQVWQPEIGLSVAAISCAEQTEERLVLVDGQQLTVAKGPTPRRITETEDSDFREKWFCHNSLLTWLNCKRKLSSA